MIPALHFSGVSSFPVISLSSRTVYSLQQNGVIEATKLISSIGEDVHSEKQSEYHGQNSWIVSFDMVETSRSVARRRSQIAI
jgi:hypothetical protein